MDNPSPQGKSKVLQFFSNHPLVGFIGLLGSIASLIALPYAIFTPKRQLTFAINPIRTPIVQLARTSNISVIYNGKPVNADVTAAQVAIWNDGRESIGSEDVLTPIVLRTASNAPIMEISFPATNDVTKFWVDTINMTNGELRFTWKILEKNDGALLQIIYVGKTNLPITLEGAVKGQRHPTQRSRDPRIGETLYFIATPFFLFALLHFGLKLDKPIHSQLQRLRAPYNGVVALLVLVLVPAVLLALLLLWITATGSLFRSNISPFGF